MSKLIKTIISLFIAISTVYLSILFTYRWFIYSGYSILISFLLSASMIGFGIFMFEVGIDFFKRRKAYIILGIGCIVIWFGMAAFSMLTTVSGQYNQVVIEELKRRESASSVDNSEEIIRGIDSEIADINNEITYLIETNKTTADIEQAAEYRTAIKQNNQRIDDLRSRKDILTAEKNEILKQKGVSTKKESSVNQGSVYDYFATIVGHGVSPVFVQFILSVFPAIFIDIIAPISTTFFLSGLDTITAWVLGLFRKISCKPVEKKTRKRIQKIKADPIIKIEPDKRFESFVRDGIPPEEPEIPKLFY